MKKVSLHFLVITTALSLQSCIGCSSESGRYNYDENYWNSVNREQALEDAGLDGAANIERKARQDYMQGGGYTSPDGERQIHYQGSKEQEKYLRMMDEIVIDFSCKKILKCNYFTMDVLGDGIDEKDATMGNSISKNIKVVIDYKDYVCSIGNKLFIKDAQMNERKVLPSSFVFSEIILTFVVYIKATTTYVI